MWLRISLGILLPAAFLIGQGVQNPALTGEAVRSREIAKTNPFTTEADLQQGSALFQLHCSYCHGSHGEGGRGADLTAGVYKQGGTDPELFKTVRIGIPGTEMPAVRVSDDEVWRLVGWVKKLGSQGLSEKAPGDAAAGKATYAKSGCAGCHRIGKDGSDLGPDLTDIGRRRGLAFLTESIVKPDAFVPNAYRAVQLEMKSGPSVSGIRLNEDDLSVQVRDVGGNPRSYMKENIKEVHRDKPSLMPSYQTRLSEKELGDLVAYLNSLKGAQ
ncbi:MAG: c-type cytochrome [Acidobacteriota bacterium]